MARRVSKASGLAAQDCELVHIRGSQRVKLSAANQRSEAMRSQRIGNHVYIALVLAAAAAVLSSPGRGEIFQKAQDLVLTATISEAIGTTGAIGGNPDEVVGR
jgi:hypothetical protein